MFSIFARSAVKAAETVAPVAVCMVSSTLLGRSLKNQLSEAQMKNPNVDYTIGLVPVAGKLIPGVVEVEVHSNSSVTPR